MNNHIKNKAISDRDARSLIESQQLSLFSSPKVAEQPYLNKDINDQPYPLQIGYIPDTDRTVPDKFCRLIHYESQLEIPGQFSHSQAKKILQITRDWDFSPSEVNGIPKCRDKLLLLLNKFSLCRGVDK